MGLIILGLDGEAFLKNDIVPVIEARSLVALRTEVFVLTP